MIQTCFVSTSSNSDLLSDYTIIENICPKDDSVKFYNVTKLNYPKSQEQTEKKRFSFMFKSMFNTSLLFLHCELTLCTNKDGEMDNLPKVRFWIFYAICFWRYLNRTSHFFYGSTPRSMSD